MSNCPANWDDAELDDAILLVLRPVIAWGITRGLLSQGIYPTAPSLTADPIPRVAFRKSFLDDIRRPV